MAVMHLRVCRWAEGRHLQGTLTLILRHSVFLDTTYEWSERRVRNESSLKRKVNACSPIYASSRVTVFVIVSAVFISWQG